MTVRPRDGRKSPVGQLLELVVIVAVALGLALLIQAFLVKPYRIPSESMVPTLAIGQRVLVDRIGNRFSDPSVGDIVVFHPPVGATTGGGENCDVPHPEDQACPRSQPREADVNFIKRVVGLPGDRISIRGGHVVRNGRLEADGYIRPCTPGACDFPRPITVPKNQYFMMGDNRGASDDSRFWGPVPRQWIIGGAFATYWPPGKIGLL